MDINYKILWFEDTDESYDTLSRRTARYVEGKNLRCHIKRIKGVSDFDISKYDLNTYEVLVVDLQLSEESKGYEIIKTIRTSKYVNDILFYSSAGVSTLDKAMKEYRLEGVFLSDRNNRMFMEKIQQLIDKSVRRSENIINIRGIVMDETSEFDSQMKDFILAAQSRMTPAEISTLKKYASKKLLAAAASDAADLVQKYPEQSDTWALSDLLSEHNFTSMMRARLVNKVLSMRDNHAISQVVDQCFDILPEVFRETDKKALFANAYEQNIIMFRNKLAHVKQLNAESPVLIGNICGIEYRCDGAFCSMMRDRLIRYGNWFNAINDCIEKSKA